MAVNYYSAEGVIVVVMYTKGDNGEDIPVYRIGDKVLVEVRVIEVDDDIDDVKVKLGSSEVWLKQSQIRFSD